MDEKTRCCTKSKTLSDGSHNPEYYEELLGLVREMLNPKKAQIVSHCPTCKEKPSPMYDYKKDNWYMECNCTGLSPVIRKTKAKAIDGWNVQQVIYEEEKQQK